MRLTVFMLLMQLKNSTFFWLVKYFLFLNISEKFSDYINEEYLSFSSIMFDPL